MKEALSDLLYLNWYLQSWRFFVYNVQIITRLSSGYPLWYIWLAEHVVVFSESGH